MALTAGFQKGANKLRNMMAKHSYTPNDKEQILDVVGELALAFLVYDRQEDDDLIEGTIEDNIANGNISVDEIVEAFRFALLDNLPEQ